MTSGTATSDSSGSGAKKKARGGAAALVAMGILLSRISGLVRDRVFAHYLGNSDPAGAFRAALRIPNFLQNLLGEGVLSASFIPVYSRLLAKGEDELAGRVAGIVGSVLALGVSIIVLLGVLLTPAFVDLVAPGFHGDVKLLTIQIVQILFPGVGLLVLSAWCLGILNSHRKFFLSYVAPVFWNAAMIVTLVAFGKRTTQSGLAVNLAWGSVVGSLAQLAVQLPFVFRYARSESGRIRFGLNTKLEAVREVFNNMGPVVLSRGVVQLSAYIDGMIASFLGAGAVASLAYAQTLYLLPIGLFGMSVAAAELPEMSGAVGDVDARNAKLRTRLQSGKRNIAFFVIPSVIAFLFLGRSVVAALYQTGQFKSADTLYVWYILVGSVVGLLAATWGRLYSSAFYALGDTRTPLRFAVVRVSLTVVLGILFAFPLRPLLTAFFSQVLHLEIPPIPGIELGMGAVGLTSSAGLAGWIEFLLLRRGLQKRIGEVVVSGSFQLKLWAIAVSSAVVALVLEKHFVSVHELRVLHYDLRPLIVIGIYGVLYLGAARAMRIDEVRRIVRF